MLILPISSPNKYRFFAKIQIFFDNFQCEIGLSIRWERNVLMVLEDIGNYGCEITALLYRFGCKNSPFELYRQLMKIIFEVLTVLCFSYAIHT